MFCKNCGKKVQAGNAFCMSCGAPITENSEVREPESMQPKSKKIWSDAKIVIWVCSVMSIIATFLPFLTASALGFSESETLAGADGAASIVYILEVVAIVLAFFPRGRKFTMIPAILSLLYILAIVISANSDTDYGQSVSMGIGFWFIFISNIVILVTAIRYHREK